MGAVVTMKIHLADLRRQAAQTPPADNLGKRVTFTMDGLDRPITRRLVERSDGDLPACSARAGPLLLSIASPVGAALRYARVGERLAVDAPDGMVQIEVLDIVEDVGYNDP